MNINTLDGNQKLGIIIALTLTFYIVIYLLFIAPILDKNTQLQAQIDKATQLSHYLSKAQKEMVNLPSLPSLTSLQAQKIIKSIFARNRIKLRQLAINNSTIEYLFKKIAFDQLLRSLKSLKNNHGITVSGANIGRVNSGNVSGRIILIVTP